MKKTDRHTKIIRTVLLTVSSLIFFIGIISAQTNPVYDKMPKILTPEADAAAIGRYGDYPIDLSTGVPSINIPLYEINVNGFRLPISISYHASGNKVDDIASTVGLGWVLNAGGAVTRTVNGYQDENNTLFGDPEPYICKYKTVEQLQQYSESQRLCEIFNIENGVDLESDFYTFNFNGISGKFAYNSNSELVLSSYDDLKISGGPRAGFNIKTPDGSEYTFFNGDSLMTNTIIYKSCWYLDRIITPNSDTIKFKYNKVSYVQGENHISYNCINATYDWKYIENSDVVGWRYLDKILFKDDTISFLYSARSDLRPYRLQNIIIKNSNGDIIKKIRFAQSYFESSGANPNDPATYKYRSRLRLDSLKFADPYSRTYQQTYYFGYNSTNLPPYFTDYSTDISYYGQDYWGYFNGVATNSHLIPITNPCSNSNSVRTSDSIYMQATILKKIVYPTGGRSEFEYQANTNRSGVLIGGLRIKSIKNFIDNVSTIPVYLRTYEYPGGGFQSNWIGRTNMDDFSRWCYINLSDGVTFNYTSVPIGRISYSDGTTIRYPEVVEFTGPQRETKSVYNFDIFQESEYSVPSELELVYGCTPPYPIIFPEGWEGPQVPHHFYPSEFYKDRPFSSGQLTRQTDYRKTGAGYKVVRDISNTWLAFHEQDNVIVGLKLTTLGPHHQSCLSSGDPECEYQYFNIYWDAGVKKMAQTIENLYDTRDSLISSRITRFEYGMINNANGHTFITKEKLIDSKGDTLWKSTRYLPEAYPVPTGVYQAMKAKNMISSPMEVISGKSIGGTDYYLGSDVFLYSSFANVPKLSQVKQLQLSVPSLSYTNLTDSRLKSRVTLDSYDLNGNIVTTTPSDDFSTAYIWGYHGRYPVAKAINAKNLINYTSGTTTGELIFQSNTFTAQSSTFTHIQSGYITLVINYGSDPGTNKTARFNYYLTGPSNMSGTLCTSSGSGCGSYLNMVTFSSMPAGAYTLTVIPQVNDLASSSVYFNYSYNNQTVSSYYTELYYQGFEEYSGATASSASMPSHAGKYFKTGSFTVPFTLPNSRSYIIEYHYWNGSKWVSMVRDYSSNMTLTDGSAFDEIRVYPNDSKMTTYTYDPLVGMTSSTDENNITTYYEYDNYGKLKNVKDQDGNIIKNYDYQFKSGNQ